MSRPFTIRRARPEDGPAVQEVHRASIRAGAGDHYTPEALQAWVGAFNPENFPRNLERMEFHVVQLPNGRIGAFVAFDLATGEIDSVYVAPWGKGLGLGSFLLGFAEERTLAADVTAVWLDSSVNAVGFYAKHGWLEVRRHARVREGVEIPVVRMEKKLTP